MIFYVTNTVVNFPQDVVFPHIKLVADNWDDYSNKTLFKAYLFLSKSNYDKIGDIKIMNINHANTKDVIPIKFTDLDDSIYCSLGQDMQFYKNVKRLFSDSFASILDSLNDVATNPGIVELFENSHGFKSSLLRWSEAETAFRQARLILNNIKPSESFRFSYSCLLESANSEHSATFNFQHDGELPHRIVGLIGKNGTGKTQYLSKLAVALSGQVREEEGVGTFNPHRPSFTKVIAVSYSAFDKFVRPKQNRSFSYKYCGLKDDKGFLNQSKLTEVYAQSVKKIKILDREYEWQRVLSQIIQEELLDFFYEELFDKNNYDIFSQRGKSLLSSGQSILMYVITEIIANIRRDSLILFDEPEMHLHPSAIASLIKMLQLLLERNDSFAILATHSPIIIQEIPSEYVYVFERFENTPIVRKLDQESFGETITTITQMVFDTVETKEPYKIFFEKAAKYMSFEEIMALFNDRLSFNAATYLKGIYNKQMK